MTRLRLILTQLAQRYDGEYAPNVEDAWDEDALDQNGEGFAEKLAQLRTGLGSDYDNVALMTIVAPDELFAAPAQPRPAEPSWLSTPDSQYGIRLIVGERTDGHETWPEIVDVWDEYVLDDNPEGFATKLAAESDKVGESYSWLKVVDLVVPFQAVAAAIAPWRVEHQATLVEPRPAQSLDGPDSASIDF